MNIGINPVSFQARIIFEPKAMTANSNTPQKALQIGRETKSSWVIKMFTKIIKPILSIKLKHPS